MVTQSSILAWRILWTEEPGGLQFIGSDMTEVTEHACSHAITINSQFVYVYVCVCIHIYMYIYDSF